MFKEWVYDEVKLKAGHLKAIGETEIYLSKEPYPWHLATKMEKGGSHRLEIATSVWFYATEPDSGLALRWSFDIEDRDANGKGYYEVNQKECCRVIQLLPSQVKKQFKQYLSDCADVIEQNATQYLDIANREFGVAKILRGI
jgi:hypothetical protein